MKLRVARNKDGMKIINLIRKCFNDYPNCYLDVKNDAPELEYIFTYFKNKKGKFWVYAENMRIIGCMGISLTQKGELEIHKLYINKENRRRGLANKLIKKAEIYAHLHHLKKITLWTDTRFKEAHIMYKNLKYKKMKNTRKLFDVSNTTEYRFEKKLLS